MKRLVIGILVGILALGVLGVSQETLNAGDYRIYFVQPDGTVITGITLAGRLDTRVGARIFGDFQVGPFASPTFSVTAATGDITSSAATLSFTGSTLVGLYGASIRFGVSDAIYMQVAVTDTTGATAITHTGNATDVTWAADSFGFTGNTTITGTLTGTSTAAFTGAVTSGSSGNRGRFTMYPETAGQGTTSLYMEDNVGDTETHISIAQQADTRTYTIPDTGASASTFLMTDAFNTYFSVALGQGGHDTDAVGTNGGGLLGASADLTEHQYEGGAGDLYIKVHDNTDGWADLSGSTALTNWTSDYQLQPDADKETAGDAFAIGFATTFAYVAFDNLAAGTGELATYAGDAGKWQYSTGAGTWADLTVFDNTDTTAQDGLQTLQRTGAITFVPPANWEVATYDGQEAYWIQWVVTAEQLTQSARIDPADVGYTDEPFVVIPSEDTFLAPANMSITRVRVTNLNTTVHDQAIEFVVANFTTHTYSPALTWAASELTNSFDLATAIAASEGDRIGVVITNDNASTDNPVVVMELQATYTD